MTQSPRELAQEIVDEVALLGQRLQAGESVDLAEIMSTCTANVGVLAAVVVMLTDRVDRLEAARP